MTKAEAVWSATYGAAFADALRRGCHGQATRTEKRTASGGVETVVEPIDATAAAKAWATTCADAAVASLGDAT